MLNFAFKKCTIYTARKCMLSPSVFQELSFHKCAYGKLYNILVCKLVQKQKTVQKNILFIKIKAYNLITLDLQISLKSNKIIFLYAI